MEIPELKLNRAKELIHTSRHIALDTTNADDSPHNSPMRFLYDEKLENILRTGQLFGVLFDRIEFGGVFMKCEGGHILEGKELEVGLEITNSSRKQEQKEKITLDYYGAGSV